MLGSYEHELAERVEKGGELLQTRLDNAQEGHADTVLPNALASIETVRRALDTLEERIEEELSAREDA